VSDVEIEEAVFEPSVAEWEFELLGKPIRTAW
jgi:hypothetical protein